TVLDWVDITCPPGSAPLPGGRAAAYGQ
ncbi:MAG: hypothetical protein QG671_1575, partial [Actinomycetota bacterium]|nr:hypothetical protein [Actinomycetota bacterium]